MHFGNNLHFLPQNLFGARVGVVTYVNLDLKEIFRLYMYLCR